MGLTVTAAAPAIPDTLGIAVADSFQGRCYTGLPIASIVGQDLGMIESQRRG
jgi:hypothetical protein